METRIIFVIGDSMFAETLAQVLACCPELKLRGTARTLKAAWRQIQASIPDVILVAGIYPQLQMTLIRFIMQHPGTSVIYTDLCTNDIQVVSSQRVAMHSFGDLLDVLNNLPTLDK